MTARKSELLAAAAQDRLSADAEALRRGSMGDPAIAESFDYRQMEILLTITMGRVQAIVGDPNGVAVAGMHNEKMLSALNGLLKTGAGMIKDLHRMRNDDRMTKHILQRHTANYAQSIASQIAGDLRGLDDALSALMQHAASDQHDRSVVADEASRLRERMRRFVRERLPAALGEAAEATLAQAKAEHKLQ